MSAKQAYQVCSFFMQFEADMIEKGRPNIAKFAREQHEKYFKLAMRGE